MYYQKIVKFKQPLISLKLLPVEHKLAVHFSSLLHNI